MDFSLYYYTEMEILVYDLYLKNGFYSPSDLDIDLIADVFNAEVRPHPKESKVYSDDDYHLIYLEKNLNKEERRSTFFHELGHVALHVGNQNQLAESFVQFQEEQAKHFQYYAAMPFYMIVELSRGVPTMKAFEEILVREFKLPLYFVKKRIEQIQNRIYLSQLDYLMYGRRNNNIQVKFGRSSL